MAWLNQRFSQSSLEPSVLSFGMLDHLILCNMLVGDLNCVFVMHERSPPTYSCTCLLDKETRMETNKGSTSLKH
jgi:hypothetical protein